MVVALLTLSCSCAADIVLLNKDEPPIKKAKHDNKTNNNNEGIALPSDFEFSIIIITIFVHTKVFCGTLDIGQVQSIANML